MMIVVKITATTVTTAVSMISVVIMTTYGSISLHLITKGSPLIDSLLIQYHHLLEENQVGRITACHTAVDTTHTPEELLTMLLETTYPDTGQQSHNISYQRCGLVRPVACARFFWLPLHNATVTYWRCGQYKRACTVHRAINTKSPSTETVHSLQHTDKYIFYLIIIF